MKNLSLKTRLIFVGIVPLLSYLTVTSYSLYTNYGDYQETTSLITKMDVVIAASNVVHETQKERGKTASFINGGTTLEDVKAQRAINDKLILAFKETLKTSSFDPVYKKSVFDKLSALDPLRSKVNGKAIALGNALKSYTQIVLTLLKIQKDVAFQTNFPEIAAQLQTLRILEDSKESGGKLRANMSAILAKNAPVSKKKFGEILLLKSGVDAGIVSSGLKLDREGKELIQKFRNSKDWQTVTSTFHLILKNSDKGGYYQDSKQFFGIITNALNVLGDLIVYEKMKVKRIVEGKKSEIFEKLVTVSCTALVFTLFVIFFMFWTAGSVSKQVLGVVSRLVNDSADVERSSELIAATSSQLSEAATRQAASLQETVSSVDEISSMVQKNSDAATLSTQVSSKSTNVAQNGQEKVSKMVSAIQEISKSNTQIMEEVDSNNKEIAKIVKLISEIGEKTNVINDIVFQTKLLSFNASVEAARAGEHGKGFAVVAEEVGNLASMSGKASLEISEMLESSIQQVKDIVEKTTSRIGGLVQVGKDKVDFGEVTAGECGEVLNEILQNASSLNEMITEIATASEEQSSGVQEVNKAMQMLDEVTHQNTASSQEASLMAGSLSRQAVNLNKAVFELREIVEGKRQVFKADAQSDKGQNEEAVSKTQKQAKAPVGATKKSEPRNVVSLNKKHVEKMPAKVVQKQESALKVSGSDTSIPSEDDPRFEDL